MNASSLTAISLNDGRSCGSLCQEPCGGRIGFGGPRVEVYLGGGIKFRRRSAFRRSKSAVGKHRDCAVRDDTYLR
jgi:hypothetical protein